MKSILAGNIARYRKDKELTQDDLAHALNVTFQAVSKWETGQNMPDIALLPDLAGTLGVSIDRLLGYASRADEGTYYETAYLEEGYYWGVKPSAMCLKVLEMAPPVKPLKLLDIGCGEGKDAVFFARCGYDVSAFDISEAGLDKLKRLADAANVSVRAYRANLLDYRLDKAYDILFSSGVLHYIKPVLRGEILQNYRNMTNAGGVNAFHVFVEKPFLAPAPEREGAYNWRSGELFSYYHDWYIESCSEDISDCHSSGIPHRHAANRLYARKVEKL